MVPENGRDENSRDSLFLEVGSNGERIPSTKNTPFAASKEGYSGDTPPLNHLR
jgi:hypothetical protein